MNTQEPIENGCMQYIPQWQEKLGWKLFPNNYTELPEKTGGKDGLHCRIAVSLSRIDRLRTLISGKIEVTAKTTTENLIGKHITNTRVSVRPPAWLDRTNSQAEKRA